MSYRGRAAHWIQGAQSIGLKPLMSRARTEDEGLFVVQHKYWQKALQRALFAEETSRAQEQHHVEHTREAQHHRGATVA
jgi:hypothetical protein